MASFEESGDGTGRGEGGAEGTGLRQRASTGGSDLSRASEVSSPSTADAYINRELVPSVKGPMYWVTSVGNSAVALVATRSLFSAAFQRGGGLLLTLGFTMWPRFNRITYHILRWPLLLVVYAFVLLELLLYLALRVFVARGGGAALRVFFFRGSGGSGVAVGAPSTPSRRLATASSATR